MIDILIALVVISRLKKFLENTMKFLLISYPIQPRAIRKVSKSKNVVKDTQLKSLLIYLELNVPDQL